MEVIEIKKVNYLIVDTWNGEGYSECSAELKHFDSLSDAVKHCVNSAFDCIGDEVEIEGKQTISIHNGYVQYDTFNDCEDSGAVHYLLIEEDVLAVALFPLINDYEVITSKERLDEVIEAINEGKEDDVEIYDEFHHEVYCDDKGGVILNSFEIK